MLLHLTSSYFYKYGGGRKKKDVKMNEGCTNDRKEDR